MEETECSTSIDEVRYVYNSLHSNHWVRFQGYKFIMFQGYKINMDSIILVPLKVMTL